MIISSDSSDRISEKIVAKVMGYPLPETFTFSMPKIVAENGEWYIGVTYKDNNSLFVIGISDESFPSEESARTCAEVVSKILIERGGEQI